MKNYIIREIAPESAEFNSFFDNDGFTEKGGDYCYNLFIVSFDHGRIYGFNTDEYNRLESETTELYNGFSDVEDGLTDYNGRKYTYKDIMHDCNISFSPSKCHALKTWYKSHNDPDTVDAITDYLTIKTGRQWNSISVYGYCQGDYAEVVYCKDFYTKNNAREYGEIWLGCAKEFSITYMEDNHELDTIYGYFVADCLVRSDEDYKTIICSMEGIEPENAQLELIDHVSYHTDYEYKVI